MANLAEVLNYLEDNLDAEHIEKSKSILKKTVNYEDTGKIALKVDCPFEKFKPYPYKEAFEDMEKMMFNELLSAVKTVEIKDFTIPMIRANYGVGIMPSLFGLTCRILENNYPWVDHVKSIDDIKRIIDGGIPDLKNGLGARVFDTHHFFREKLSQYPKCNKYIPIYHPDLQGPFDVAHLIWGPDIYYVLYDEPETVHELLGLITDTYIRFLKEIKKDINDEEEGFCFHWGTLYKGSVVIRDDSPVNLSKDMYLEFVKPYDDKILKGFGKGSIHYCGRADQWIFEMMKSENLEAMNFGQPANLIFGFDFLGKIYPEMKERKIANISYQMDKKLIPELVKSEYTAGITFLTVAESADEALKIIEAVY